MLCLQSISNGVFLPTKVTIYFGKFSNSGPGDARVVLPTPKKVYFRILGSLLKPWDKIMVIRKFRVLLSLLLSLHTRSSAQNVLKQVGPTFIWYNLPS